MFTFNYKINSIIQGWLKYCNVTCNRRCFSTKLVEIGKLETPKTDRYQAGQLFIHKYFGYRGLIVLHWTGQVYDRDLDEDLGNMDYEFVVIGGRKVKYYTKHYYQVFIDSRDRPLVRTLDEGTVAETASSSNGSMLHCSPGLDYVAHEHILPYKATEPIPVKHEMLGDFFVYRPGNSICFEPKETLKTCQKRNSALMTLDIHKATTENIRAIGIPSYLGTQQVENTILHSWKYLIQLENLSNAPTRLLSQNWKVVNLMGGVEEVYGHGVMGEEVVMDSSFPMFQFSNYVNLITPFGHLIGIFKMEKEDLGLSKFSCHLPHILLDSGKGLQEVSF